MCSPSYAIEMDDRKRAASTDAVFKFRCYNPHSGVLVYLILRSKPFNQGAWIVCTARCKGKKKADASNDHALHNTDVQTYLNEDSVISSAFTSPTGVRVNPLLIHTTGTTEITRCEKLGHCRMKNMNSANKDRALLKRNIVS